MKYWAIILVSLLSTVSAIAGPFGFEMGMSKSSIESLLPITESGDNFYSSISAPKPNSNFESYTLQIGEDAGLCMVAGVGKDVSTSGAGLEVKSRFAILKTALTAKYGAPVDYDFLHSGSIWNESHEWMMSLIQKERSMVSVWSVKNAILADDKIGSIMLKADALSKTTGYLTLRYEFVNKEGCDSAKQEADYDSL